MIRIFSLTLLISWVATSQAQESMPDSLKTIKGDEVTVSAERPFSAASDAEFRAADLQLRPKNSAQDMLRIVPGLFIAQHAGGGKAEQIFLRGFDCDHGTDINISVDGAPVNMVSHGHGQGYADLHFVIPETIEKVEVEKGPYFARFGDLATAGAVTFHTFDQLEGNIVKVETGTAQYAPEIQNRAFTTYRALALLQAPIASDKLHAYFGAEIYRTQGYFDLPQNFDRLNLIAKATGDIGEDGKLSASLLTFSSGWNANGQIPERAVGQGLISRFGSLDSTEGGATSRTSGIISYTSGGMSPFRLSGSFTDYHFRLYSNFTFFANDSLRGDEIEQTDSRSVVSLRGESEQVWQSGSAILKMLIGANLRSDNIEVGLFHDSARARLETKVDAVIHQTQVGPYIQQEIIFPGVQIQAGLRVDYFNFDVADRLSPSTGPNGIVHALVASPKLNVALPLGESVTLFGNSGFGFHSNDARAIVSTPGENVIPRAFGMEFGARLGHTADFISGSMSLWRLDLESEFVWGGDDGTTSAAGRTRRQGIDMELRVTPLSWLAIGADMTLAKGVLRDEPVGENFIPLAPNMTLTANLLAHFEDFSAALRLRSIDDRPAIEDNSVRAKGYSVFDLSTSYRIGRIELFANIENVFNVQWNEAQFDTDARLRGESGITSDLHFTAGTPRSLRLGVGYKF
ncbi:MAG: TonB-dependent receptor [Ignavibacteriota bacterium]